jgi:hypothetical protein
MSAIIHKTAIKLQLCLTQEINTESTAEGETRRKEDSCEKHIFLPFILQRPIYGV